MTDNLAAKLKEIHSARGEFYAFLSRVFSNVPDDNMYQMLNEISQKLQMLAEESDNENIRAGTEGITDFLKKRNSLSSQELPEFDLDRARHYTTLLCLKTSVPADESIYTSFDHMERSGSYDELLELFGKYKMRKADIPENEDFIGYELLFMSKLAYDCAKFIVNDEADTYNERLKAQYNFHLEHMDKWIYDFFTAIIRFGIEDEILYKFCACFALGFIQEDKIALEELDRKPL
jgi:TorA maturation chaperone TorD